MYNPKYYFTFYSDRDTRIANGFPDEYLCQISQLDFGGEMTEIQAQQNPIQINYQNTSSDKLEPIIGSECTLNLIATEDFELEDLYTENEREFLVQVYRKETPNTYLVNWELEEDLSGVDANLEILVNGIQIVNQFNSASGSFSIDRGDTVLIKSFSYSASSGNNGVNLEITNIATQRSVIYPFSIDTTIIPTSDVNVYLQSTHSATYYTAIRSAVFETYCLSGEGSFEVFTKYYDSVTSQVAAQALADADTGFNAEGQDYADSVGVCYVAPGEFDDLIWQGFIIPDGCQEAFTFAPYPISVNAVDGLGLLKNLSYVQNDGNFYLGKQSFIEVIEACLVRLDAPSLVLNTCVNIYETSMTQGNTYDPLNMSFVNSERYLKDDQVTPMNCEEVLKSILQEWTAVMVQSGGEWYIYRPTELALSGALVFRRYLDGFSIYDQPTLTSALNATLGGESEGLVLSPYFHINTDQMKMIDKPYKNASMSYLFGLMQNADEELDNPTFAGAINEGPNAPIGPDDAVLIPGWTKTGVVYAGTLLPVGGGVIFYSSDTTYPVDTSYYENDNNFLVQINEILKIKINYKNVDDFTQTDMNFIIMFTDGLIEWFLQTDGSWGIVAIGQGVNVYSVRSESTDLDSEVNIVSSIVPSSGTISFKILPPSGSGRDIIYKNISAKAYLTLDDTIGEIHTATQTGKFTFVPEIINVFNGDSVNTLFAGAIYQDDQLTLTERWVRRNISESVLAVPYEANKEFLRIAVEEKQRLYAGPFVRFEGSIFGYFNPVQRWSINLIDGYFMNLSLNYDLQQNICKAVLGRIVNEEIAMDYLKTPDYGATTKVTVKGQP